MVPTENIFIDSKCGLTSSPSLPKSLSLTKSVSLPAGPISLCQYREKTYLGLDNREIVAISKNYQVQTIFTGFGVAESIFIQNDTFYILMMAHSSHFMYICDMNGQLLVKWTHSDSVVPYYTNSLTIISDQLIVADRSHKEVTVYSLKGETLRRIPCPLLGNQMVSFSPLDDSSIVVADYENSLVFRIDIENGEVAWKHKEIPCPPAITRHKQYLAVAGCITNTMKLLDITSGKFLFYIQSVSIFENVW